MNKLVIVLGAIGIVVVFGLTVLFMGIGYSNQEIGLRNLIKNKITDNQNEFDNMWKKISQVAQVAKKDRESLMQLFNGYAQARTPQGGDAPFMRWVQESVPNVQKNLYENLINIITSSRDSFTMRQKELIDYKREHDNLIQKFPSNLFVGKRGQIDIPVITSDHTQEVFKSKKDNSVELGL